MNAKTESFEVSKGSVRIPVYHIHYADEPSRWCVAWRDHTGRRQRKTFADRSDAETFAKRKASEIASQQSGVVLTLTGTDKASYEAARRESERFGCSLIDAIAEWAEARKLLPPGGRLLNAVREYTARHPSATCPPIPKIVADLLEAKRAAGRSNVHVDDLDSRLGRFAEDVRTPLPEVTAGAVEDWLGSLKAHTTRGKEAGALSPRTRRNYLQAVTALVRFAERRGWIGKGALDLSTIEHARTETEVAVFTPEELRRLFSSARRDFVPFLALGAFAGLRHAEIARLDWSQIGTEFVEVKASQAKTRSRRIVPVLPALAAWLAPLRKESGSVCRFKAPWNEIARLREASGVTWKPNGLRHSFGTYRLALVKAEGQVALEMGNTPQMVFRHYRAVATPQQAEAWFNVLPAS